MDGRRSWVVPWAVSFAVSSVVISPQVLLGHWRDHRSVLVVAIVLAFEVVALALLFRLVVFLADFFRRPIRRRGVA